MKIDFKKDLKELFSASPKDPSVVNVSATNYLMIDGKGDPDKKDFQEAVKTLYGVAYGLKFALKKAKIGSDYSVAPLEGLWWTKNGIFDMKKKNLWQWTLMIMQPEHITAAHFKKAVTEMQKKKANKLLNKVRLEDFEEGLCVQLLHIGSYSAEPKTIKRLHDFINEAGCEIHGKHHEIYLSDPQKTPSSKLKTILRQPILMPSCCGKSCSSCGAGCG